MNQFFSCLCSFIFERAQFVNLLGCIHVMQEDNMASQKPSTSFDSSQTQPYICLKKKHNHTWYMPAWLSGFSTADSKFVSIVRRARMVSTGDNEI
jgi:hypothetical protein